MTIERYFYTFPGAHTHDHGLTTINDDNCVLSTDGTEWTPIEDFGDWLISETKLTPKEAFARFLGCLERDGV